MRFAESVRTRCALVLSTLATAGVLVYAWPTAGAAMVGPRPAVQKMRGCGAGHRVAKVDPPQEDPYVVTLRSARPALEQCMAKHPNVQVRLSIEIAPSGRVENVEVKTIAHDLANVDLKIVKCVETAVSSLEFPAAADPKRISTFLQP
ncbi:MAG: hypothetical protein IPQ07_10995 [Myxococcales bacterium]|nr:hypothetical protein [Myxococcales bacterium]